MMMPDLRLYDMQRILIAINRSISSARSMVGFCLLILSLGMWVHGRGAMKFIASGVILGSDA